MHQRSSLLPLVAFALAACAGGGDQRQTPAVDTPQTTPATTDLTPDAGGRVIVVQMSSDEKGNYFSPNKVETKAGDVVRYTMKVGVHNVHFLADSNPGKTGLPPMSDMLQLPGQTYDIKVGSPPFTPGTYYFQCDPHALLGMQGRLIVTK